jgi:RNA polymerase sigma-70 factor (ECF subfamily)
MDDPATQDDWSLVRGALAGRREDFMALVERHQRSLQRFVEHRVDDRASADDIVQMTFVQAYTRLDTFRAESSFKTWIYTVALNLCRDRARFEKRRANITAEEALEREPHAAATLEETILGATVERRVAALPDRQRSVLGLRIWGDLSFREIGAMLGISENSAKVSYHHAIRRLREWLGEGRA